MILLLGGTTEGRHAAAALEEAGTVFYYSTKTGEQSVTLHHGVSISGALDEDGMSAFCRSHGIRLIVDASHPFAQALHQTAVGVAARLGLPLIRYERIYPERDNRLTWLDSIDQLNLEPPTTLLATTGVKSISLLKPLEERGVKIIYRILPRESSIRLARQQGARDDQLCFYHDYRGEFLEERGERREERDMHWALRASPLWGDGRGAILLKESGLSGGFCEKVRAAQERGMKIYVVKRPPYPASPNPDAHLSTVNGPHGLRRMVERLLPEFYPLHSGLTTGTCATAAAKAATLRLLRGEQPNEVMVTLPNGEQIAVAVGYGDGYAYAKKESGDDPDVTNGVEVRVSAERSPQFEIAGGEGVGRFTLPGFDYPPGQPAINRGPRQMMADNVAAILSGESTSVRLTVSVPGGEAIARKTFNPRLGIEGGISIIGVSGIVKPFSEEAFIQSIRKCLEVARASGSSEVVINSGGKSERFVKARYPELPQQAFVEYGNYIGKTLQMAAELHIARVTLGVMLGKAVKLAAGHLDTHSRRAVMDKHFISEMLRACGIGIDISAITLARELWQAIPPQQLTAFANEVKSRCYEHCKPLLPNGELTILLIDEQGTIY